LIGRLSRDSINHSHGFVLISSRASYEMVHKAANAGIHTLVAVSAPTSLAVQLAKQANLNLVGFARAGRHVYYTHDQPLGGQTSD
jgi:FdhD protein